MSALENKFNEDMLNIYYTAKRELKYIDKISSTSC